MAITPNVWADNSLKQKVIQAIKDDANQTYSRITDDIAALATHITNYDAHIVNYNAHVAQIDHELITRVKILPSEFTTYHPNAPEYVDWTVAANLGGVVYAAPVAGSAVLVATKEIPTGYKATAVMVYGTAGDTAAVYEGDINVITTTSRASGNPNTEMALSPAIAATTTNYLAIAVGNAAGTRAYGGYITIAPI
ncbi:MAG: hypothetical protein ACYTEQ_18975 [Planctomycetota bacterium]|jgi:hypothetical protein